MTMNDPLSNTLSKIEAYEKLGKRECYIKPISQMIIEVLRVMREKRLIGETSIIKDGKGDILKVNLIGTLNKCNSIKPTYPVSQSNFEKFEKRYLPAMNFGILILTTNQGVMDHHEAKKKGIGGKLLAYCY